MDIKTIRKYIRMYRVLLTYSVIKSTTYRANFFWELIIEFGYQIGLVVFFYALFGHITQIAGWSYYEVLFLAGVNIVYGGLLWGMVFVFGLTRLPEDIKNGNVDITLLKPMHPLFGLTLSKPYFTSLSSTLIGIGVMYYAALKLGRTISVSDLFFGIIIFCCGLVIAYSIAVMFSALSFWFLNSSAFQQVGERIIDMYTRNPHDVYRGGLRVILFFIVPLVFVSSVPSSTVLRGVEFRYVFLGLGLAAIFLCAAILIWNRMIRYYSSASS